MPIEQHSDDPPASDEPPNRGSAGDDRPVSSLGLVLIFAALAAALVLGYLFVNKLADMSIEEDCAMARRHNC